MTCSSPERNMKKETRNLFDVISLVLRILESRLSREPRFYSDNGMILMTVMLVIVLVVVITIGYFI